MVFRVTKVQLKSDLPPYRHAQDKGRLHLLVWLQCRVVLQLLFLLFALVSLSPHAVLVVWTAQVLVSAPCCCDALICLCEDLFSLGTNVCAPTARAFHQESICCTVYWYFRTLLCTCILKLKLGLLQESQLCSSATALETLACCSFSSASQICKVGEKLVAMWMVPGLLQAIRIGGSSSHLGKALCRGSPLIMWFFPF